MLGALVRLVIPLLLSFVALVFAAVGGADRVPEYEAPVDAALRAGHERDDRIADRRTRTRMLRAASGTVRVRTPLGSARVRLAAFDDLDDDAGADDAAPPLPPASHGPDEDAGTECSMRAFHTRAPDDRAIVAAAEQSANLGPASGFARRHEHPPKA